jgi:branched-chain amino acid transport system substrate-binding protein
VKKVLFLLFSCLLLVAMIIPVTPACKGGGGAVDLGIPAGAKTVNIGVIGPMQYIQGECHWWGAIMGAQEINGAGGFKVGNDTYYVNLTKADSNEINSITDASAAMEKLITVDKAQYVVGGFRTEAVFPMQEVAMDNKTIFLDCGAATLALCQQVSKNYDRYKYFFRVTPFADIYLVNNSLYMAGMVGAIIKEDTGINRPLNAAILSEGAEWADGITNVFKALVPSKLGMNVVGVWRPSPTSTDLTAEMTAIQAANADIILTTISGPVGIPYARSYGELKVPAASVGINVEAQSSGFWQATNGLGNYETTQATYCTNMGYSPLTLPFVNEFIKQHGQIPNYTAATYDAIKILTAAITRAGTFDSDAVVAELEKTDTPGTASTRFEFTGLDAPQGDAHDVTYGPGFATGMAMQWQDGKPLGVWPNPQYPPDATWKDVNYQGVVRWEAPPALIDRLKAEAATQPAAPAAPAAPATPAAPTTPTAPTPTATSFKAKTYTNSENGFSIQYPDSWVERPDIEGGTKIAVFSVAAFIPGVTVSVRNADAPLTADWIVAADTDEGNTSVKVTSDVTATTLDDGTPASQYTETFQTQGYELTAFAVAADKGGKRIRATVWTIDAFSPYDGKLFSEIAHTLSVK